MDANKKYLEARELTYAQLPTNFVSKKETHQWFLRKRGFAFGRLHFVPPGSGELYYLRLLLNSTKGPTSYADIRTINNIVYTTFKEACYGMGFLDDDKEFIDDGIKEASLWGTAAYLRKLFATLLFSNQLVRPEVVWDNTWRFLRDDISHRQRLLLRCEDLQLSEEELKNHTLAEIENLLRSNNRSLSEFSSTPYLDMSLLTHSQN
ncbi:ATP-dependent DNA helicase PIF1 [Senna tora]|uniref:ATP-dependent DNA helicase PIF1 n=1 Tax=Senna tora TaxID=362788 RepID=A0A834WKQ2_9FABA|nr:ATP-dependent DNA helicase PIF1 [Senna tora]